ncbi:MAG: nitrilase-related carbon-nitrogen hydrolase [Holophaga sp.]
MQLHLSRFVCMDVASNLARMEQEGAQAAKAGADLCVFPESFLHGYRQQVDPAAVRARFRTLSGDHPQTAFLFGSFTEGRRNRLTVWQAGEEKAHYDKIHLFRPNGEFDLWDPGDRYVAVRLKDWVLGLMNCNDLRFPEQARTTCLQAGCDALATPAWWPWRRDHVWRTLLQARAIENGVFAIGCCIAACEHPEERFAGAGNHVFDPLGDPVRTQDDHTYLLDHGRREHLIVDPVKSYVDIKDVKLF